MPSFLKKLSGPKHSQAGAAIIIVLIVGASVVGLSVYLMNLVFSVEKDIQTISDREKYLRMNQAFREVFDNPILCTAALSGKNITGAFSPNGMSLLPFTTKIYGSNQNINSSWKSDEFHPLKDIILIAETTPVKTGLLRDIPSPPTLDATNATIRVYAETGTPVLSKPKYEHLNIKVMLYYETTGANRTLYSCFRDNGEGAMCTMIGGVYNAYAAIGNRSRCEPFEKCHLDGQGAGPSSITCTAPFQKVQISPDRYFCQWCNSNL